MAVSVFVYFWVSIILTALIIPVVKGWSHKIGYVDKPAGDGLKIHENPIPHSGGIAIFGIFSLCTLFLHVVGRFGGGEIGGIWLGGGIVFILGVWDDLKSMNPFFRLTGAAVAGVAIILFGCGIKTAFIFSLPLTLFYVAGAVNAFNMQDGIDGLAGGMAFLSFIGFAILSMKTARASLWVPAIIMCGAMIGFLFYNFHPAKIFMGDSGSYFLGFMLAFLAIQVTDIKEWPLFIAPILIIGVPVFDAAYAIMRRLMRGVSPFSGDRSHFYDQLMQMGLSVRKTVVICWGIQAVFVICGVLVYLL